MLFVKKVISNIYLKRSITTSCSNYGKRNFRKFLIPNKRGTRIFKKEQIKNPIPEIPIDLRGARETGMINEETQKYEDIPEMIPELIVPNLEGFNLKPYVSYKVSEVIQSKFTAQDLFDSVYSQKITEDFQSNKLDEFGNPLEPSENEKLTAEEAKILAKKTGTDIF